MKLNPEEEKMLAWLRRQHENWKGVRTITLICSVLLGCYALVGAFGGASSYEALPMFAIAAFGLSYTLGSWAGRPEISLLLRLVERAVEEGRSQAEDGK
jgi:hypothetical protein